MRALVTGATGLVGGRLVAALDSPTVLSRDRSRVTRSFGKGVNAFSWSPEAAPPPAEAFAGVDCVFHLAGEPVADGRWTSEKKRRIRESRVRGTRNLVTTLASLAERPRVLVAASAVGFYGDRGDEILDEASPGARDFLAAVCGAWEAESLRADDLGIRVVLARTGIVLSPRGGALQRLLLPFRLGAGGPLGDGGQWMAWVHVDDVVGLLLHAARTGTVAGPMNVVSPGPVRNRAFARTLGEVLHRPARLHVPRFGLRAAFGDLSQVLLASQRVVPDVAQRTGYRFRYEALRPALEACLNGTWVEGR